jgi:hypothetical protein
LIVGIGVRTSVPLANRPERSYLEPPANAEARECRAQ